MTALRIYKEQIHREPKLMKGLYDALEEYRVQPSLFLTGVDSVVIAAAGDQLRDKIEALQGSIERHVRPASFEVIAGLALLGVVGEGLASRPGAAYHLFSALEREKIELIFVEGGSSGLSLTVGLEEGALPAAMRAIYRAFA